MTVRVWASREGEGSAKSREVFGSGGASGPRELDPEENERAGSTSGNLEESPGQYRVTSCKKVTKVNKRRCRGAAVAIPRKLRSVRVVQIRGASPTLNFLRDILERE